MRVFHIDADQFTELIVLPDQLPQSGHVWVSTTRQEWETAPATLQANLQRWAGGQLVDLHVSDLRNSQLPSHFDYTSWYDLLVFRRLATAGIGADPAGAPAANREEAALSGIDTSPVGFAVFERVLLTVHPTDCSVRAYFTHRLLQQKANPDAPTLARMPPSPADLMLRMVNHMVDNYLELRRVLTKQISLLQQEMFSSRSNLSTWRTLLDSRNTLHMLEDICEDQQAAITEWIDALDEWPDEPDNAALRERELLRVRSRDVLEHIQRVLAHVRRLESSAENAVQMHFSAQSNRTNEIMRTLTVLTAIFMPLNLVTGIFGMNFEGLPFIRSALGFWITFGFMLTLGVTLALFFWRKRYLA